MWQRFTVSTRRCILYAQWEAERVGGRFVCSEHLLLGLCKEATTPESKAPESTTPQAKTRGEFGGKSLGTRSKTKQMNQPVRPAEDTLSPISRPLRLVARLKGWFAPARHEPMSDLLGMGLNWERVRAETEGRLHPIIGASGEMQLTRRARRILDLAYDEARQLGQTLILPQHLLLGILREHDGIGAQSLQKLGIEMNALRRWVQEPGSGMLLRASHAGMATPEELVRPVSALYKAETDLLLRPLERREEEA